MCSTLPVLGCGSVAAPTNPQAFRPNWDSLVEGYKAPDWFRDAKFGIWAHWGPQCVPEQGDWYARNMYLQGNWQHDYHVQHYGHPTRYGFMEIMNQWKAEHWDPEALMDLYVKAGAKYFVALANHHDNLDTFNSKYHAWNTTRVGPKRDIIGTWAKVARARGMRFGVSNHSAHAWHWWQPAYGYDPEGPMAAQRYDAWQLTKEDGRGKWWEGLDPQELYTGRNMPLPDGYTSIEKAQAWHAANDGQWLETPPPDNPAFVRSWFLRCIDLLDSYRPDLVYFDDTGLPLGQAGLEAAAHFYNASMAWHGGKLEAVINAKMMPEERRPGLVEDVERGYREDIQPLPWQTDTCIGEWHYARWLPEKHEYKSAASVIHRLCDIVSKNGNLLLSIPMRGDGTIDADERQILQDLAAWMGPNGEAIHGTRPWRVYGEGPNKLARDDAKVPFTADDIRFTTKAGALYAIVLGWPRDGVLRIATLAEGSRRAPGKVERVEVVGSNTPLNFTRTAKALEVKLPEGLAGSFAVAVKIQGAGLAP